MADQDFTFKNQLLSVVQSEIRLHWLASLELVFVNQGDTLYESGKKFKYLYFPETSVIALVYNLENGQASEVAKVGYEGVIGIPTVLGSESNPNNAIVQTSGSAYRIDVEIVKEDFTHNIIFRELFLIYTQALITQTSQLTVCNRHHTLDQQLSRWLLSTLDRISSSEIKVTHELISCMLGVRREGITEAVGRLKNSGVICCSRGLIKIINKNLLINTSCECHSVVKKEYERLFSRFTTI